MSLHETTRDLSFAFQPVIHEPLSNPEFLQNNVNRNVAVNGGITDGTHEQKVLLATMKEAFESKVQHPRRAMSLFLKAGKGLVSMGDEETALECFESLIHLAKEQLNHVCAEKSKLPPLTSEERTELYHKNSPRKHNSIKEEVEQSDPKKPVLMLNGHCEQLLSSKTMENGDPDMKFIDCHSESSKSGPSEVTVETPSFQEITTHVVQASDESNVVVVQEESVAFYSPESPLEDNSFYSAESSLSLNTSTPLHFGEPVVQKLSFDHESVITCAAELVQEEMQICEPVESAESVTEVCEVDTVESGDNISVCSIGSMDSVEQTHENEIVMECVTTVVEEVSMSPVKKALIRRGYVVNELLDTEQSYIQDLGHVVKGFISEFSSCSDLPLELKNKEKEVFSNLEEIYEWHSKEFYIKVKQFEDEPDVIGDVFIQSEQRMEELYSEYCRNKLKSDSLVQRYADFFFKSCKERLGQRLQLSDYLIKPVQRITKYQLLLKDILKQQERAGEDCTQLGEALDVALRILKRTNDMVNVGMLQGFEVNPGETGELILQDEFIVVDGKAKTKGKERRVFLFEKIIIFSEPMTREGGLPAYRYIHNMKTKGIGQTESVDSNPCKWAVWLRKRGGAEIFILQASSPETKETWINAIKECHHSKKRAGLLKSWYKHRGRSSDKETNSPDAGRLRIRSPKHGESRRTTFKRKTSKSTKSSRKLGEMSPSERLRENIKKYRTEARLLAVDPTSFEDESDEADGLENSSVLQSPSSEKDAEIKGAEMSSGERWLKLEAEENQLQKLLHVTRMIAARLLQLSDRERALGLYSDVIAGMLSMEELRKLEGVFSQRDVILGRSQEIYEAYRNARTNSGLEVEDSYNSLTNLLNETAGFASVIRGSSWSVVLYSLTAAAACREQHWRDASQAFYRASMVYTNLQATMCAVDSLLDAHWVCCQAEDYFNALQFLYNGFIRALAAKDLIRCLRLEQQALHLVDKINSLGPRVFDLSTEEGELDARQQINSYHVEFLVNMSRATRRRDWAWFEIAETELQKFCSGNGHQADAILQTVFLKIKKSLPGTS